MCDYSIGEDVTKAASYMTPGRATLQKFQKIRKVSSHDTQHQYQLIKLCPFQVKYAEVSSKNDCLREEIGELQVREMKERERSKKYRERIAQLTKAKVECLLKIENFKSTWAKVAEQDWKIKEIDEYMKDKGELVISIVGLLGGLCTL